LFTVYIDCLRLVGNEHRKRSIPEIYGCLSQIKISKFVPLLNFNHARGAAGALPCSHSLSRHDGTHIC